MRQALLLLGAAATVSGCATGMFSDAPADSREKAIAACVESVPAETVPYADAFAACMEGYGWIHRSASQADDSV